MAGKLAVINPRLRSLDLPISPYVASPTAAKVTVPASFLDKTYLYGGMVEAATDNCLTLGTGSRPLKVRFKVEGDRLLMLADQREFVPDLGASSEDVLNRYPITEEGDKVSIDFAHPEVVNVSLVLGNTGYQAQRPGYIYDVVQEPGFLSYGEKYLVLGDGSNEELPARITLAIKYYLKETSPSATYKPRPYTDEEFEKFGFFVTQRVSRNQDGTEKSAILADRRDLAKKIVYLLHPSIPEKFRPAFRESILSWNKVFKQSHGLEPVEVRDGTDAQIPGDIRCNVIYWVDYPTRFGGGAIGPHTSDPDTGEIIDADVVFYAGAFRDEIASFRKEADGQKKLDASDAALAAAVKEAQNPGPDPATRRTNRKFSMRFGSQGGLEFDPGCEYPIEETAALVAQAHLDINSLTDDEAMDRIIRETIVHEIGHTLGLRHNFKASSDLKNLPEGAVSTTVMDYVTSLLGTLEPGPYDHAAIAHGYDGDTSASKGVEFLFATDGSQAEDPLSNQFDQGNPLEFYTAKFKHFAKLVTVGWFPSYSGYGRAQRRNLEAIRKFVNRAEAESDKAFEFLIQALATKGEQPPYNLMERIQALTVLTEAESRSGGSFEALDDQQLSVLASTLMKAVLPDGKDSFDLRLAMMQSLKGMNNIYGFKALETIAGAYKQAMDAAATDKSKQLPPREQEMFLRIQQAVGNYFAR
jgi:hypothetical protein